MATINLERTTYTLCKDPDPVLHKKARVVTKINPITTRILASMVEIMNLNQGVGLAANQIGLLDRLIVAKDTESGLIYSIINPKLVYMSTDTNVNWEACLSIPKVKGMVERSNTVRLNYRDVNKQCQTIVATGAFARVLQHEVDHLDGILYPSRMEDDEALYTIDEEQEVPVEMKHVLA